MTSTIPIHTETSRQGADLHPVPLHPVLLQCVLLRRPVPSRSPQAALAALLALAAGSGCQAAEIGQSCVTADESVPAFSGFALGEINIEGVGGSCGPELVCLVNRFQGRVSCPDGQAADELGRCLTPEGEPVSVPVEPQLESRPADRHVICSCRCAGPEANADYCSCPSGMICEELITPFGREGSSVAGSYCTYPTAGEPLDEPSAVR